MKRYTNALILTVIMILSFPLLLVVSIYQEQPKNTPCSSYINKNCEGYHTPMCERE